MVFAVGGEHGDLEVEVEARPGYKVSSRLESMVGASVGAEGIDRKMRRNESHRKCR